MSLSTILTSKRTISAIVCSLSIAAMAATPVAVWDGDFSPSELTKFTGYELVDWQKTHGGVSHEGGTATDYSSVTIDRNNQGLMFNASSAMPGVTVLVKYSNLESSSSKNRVLAASCVTSSHQYDRTGITLKSNGTLVGLWNSSTTENSDTDNGTASGSIAASGVMAFAYSTAGTYLYYGARCADISTTAAWGSSGLKASTDTAIYGAAIGGMNAGASRNGYEAAKGMTIEALAVFNRVLTVAEMNAYVWPSEVQTIPVAEGIAVSSINSQIDANTYKAVKVVAEDGATITVDEAFSTALPIAVSSTGSIMLSAASQPDASYNLANVDFSGVQGAVLRSWLTPGVVGFNFRSASGEDVSGALATTDNWIHDNNSASGTSTAMFADGLSTLKWSSANTWSCSGSTIISGYLDDGANGGNGATVTLSNVPYETYDVIVYCSSDSNPGQFLAKTVNGTTYTWDTAAGAVVAGNSVWGKAALSTPVYGVNALRIKNLSGPLTIYGTARNGSNRGGIAAIEIMPPNTPDNIRTYKLTLNGTATTWSGGAWTLNDQTVDAPASGYVEIVATASTALTVDQAVNLADLKISGGENIVVNIATNDTGSLYAIKATVESGVFQQGSPAVLGATPSIAVASGATFDVNGMAVNEANAFTIAGAGAGSWPWALTSSGGEFPTGTLRGFTLTGDATIGGANKIGCGKSGAASYLGFSTYTLTKIGGGELSFTNIRSATGSTGTFDIAGGSVTLNEYTNLDGSNADGDPWAKTEVIVRGGASLVSNIGRWVWVGSLVLDGGAATTASSYIAMQDGFAGAGTLERVVFKGGASALLTGNLDVTSEMVLNGNMSFVKDQTAASDVVVTPAALTASSGTITVGSGVTFNVGTSRPETTISVLDGGTLAAQLQSTSDVIALSTSAQPANVILYDANGDVVSNPSISYSDGTLTIMPHVPTLEATGTVAFDTASNWNDSAMPSENGEAIIQLTGDAAITISGTYTLGSLTITGSGVVTFSGEGTIAAVNISVKNGATFTRNANISATTGISIDSGTVLRLDGVTESAAISGAGAVETYGTVVLAHANTMTGGITVKPGSALSTTAAGGYGEYQSGWAYTAQRQVVVEDGGTVDINNIANRDGAVALTIAGKGILSGGVYSGAVTYSGTTAITSGSRQISSLVLTGDALVDVGVGWGLVHSSWGNARLGLNGHTLTVRGTSTFPIANVNNLAGAATSGKLILDGATLELSKAASNLTNVNIVAKGCATINLATAPTALGSLTISPTASGTTASNWNLPTTCVPVVNTANVDPSGLSAGQSVVLFTDTNEHLEYNSNIVWQVGGRFEGHNDAHEVTATYAAGIPQPFLHYDFNNGAAVDTGKASDSKYQISSVGEASSVTLVNSRNGKAVQVHTDYTPYWSSSTAGISSFHAGEATVATVARLKETGIILWGLGNNGGSNTALGLVAPTTTSAAVIMRNPDGTITTLATVSDTDDLTKGWHLFVVVADANGTTFYVDKQKATSDVPAATAIGQEGQLGSFYGGAATGYNKAGANGYLLDDWRVYDAALTAKEIKALKRELNPDPLFIRLR